MKTHKFFFVIVVLMVVFLVFFFAVVKPRFFAGVTRGLGVQGDEVVAMSVHHDMDNHVGVSQQAVMVTGDVMLHEGPVNSAGIQLSSMDTKVL